MKLEKLNDNQIRCTLSKSDLDKRELRLSELAYGSAKARALFRDMIQQASIELGFEADNIPLMIEAIPVSNECLVLVVTKVEDPDELDTRFSRFSSPSDDEFPEHLSYDSDSPEEDSFGEGIFDIPSFGDSDSSERREGSDLPEDALDLIAPFTQAIAQAKKEVLRKKKKAAQEKKDVQHYTFSSLDTVIRLSGFLVPFYAGESSLYKDSADNLYHLFLIKRDCEDDCFRRACTIASDYGHLARSSYSSLPYFEEHFQRIFQENALDHLNKLN
ncbi:MAG: adaptor protein MecA [Eubacteriales bacterium]|nr:adaptor protein MecA [Eubacteriales bacterium]